jgi:SAM-dependent methyltransferase
LELKYEDYCYDSRFRVFRQKDLIVTVNYDTNYVKKYENPNYKNFSEALDNKRSLFVARYTNGRKVLDFGCGVGDFVKCSRNLGLDCYGWDIANYPLEFKVSEREVFGWEWDVVTFFDSLEHVPDPVSLMRELKTRYIVISLPECHFPEDPDWFMNWKHRKPGEHLWHFDRRGLDEFMKYVGFRRIVHSNYEDKIRTPYDEYLSNILSGVYEKCL